MITGGYNTLTDTDCSTNNSSCQENTSAQGNSDPHGTHAAGTLVSQHPNHRGVAPGARAIIVKVQSQKNSFTDADLADGIQWCVTNAESYNIGAIVVPTLNTTDQFNETSTSCNSSYTSIRTAVQSAETADIPVFFAAGNAGVSNTAGVSAPGCVSEGYVVSGVAASGSMISSQNYGSLVDLLAPGENILSTGWDNDSNISMSGSDVAATFAAGAAVLARQYNELLGNSAMTESDILNALQRSGVWTVKAHANDPNDGYRRIDVMQALKYIKQDAPTITEFPSASSSVSLTDGSLTWNAQALNLENSHGAIAFPTGYRVFSTGQDFDTYVDVQENFIRANASGLHADFNAPAEITFKNVDCDNYDLYWNSGVTDEASVLASETACESPNCTNVACSDGTLTFDVPTPTTYAVVNTYVAPTCSDETQNQDETGVDCGGAVCSACVIEGLTSATGQWKFDESSGTTLTEEGGKFDGTFTAATRAAGVTGNALSFDGIVGYASIPHDDALAGTTELAVEAWVKMDPTTEGRNIITKASDYILRLSNMSSNGYRVNFVVYAPSYTSLTTDYVDLVENPREWHDLLGTYDGTTMKIYVDGELLAQKAHTGEMSPSNTVIKIGGEENGDKFKGSIDDIAIYAGVMDVSEVGTRFASVDPPSCSDSTQNGDETGVDCGGLCTACESGSGENGPTPVARWDFNQGSGTTLIASVGGYNATLNPNESWDVNGVEGGAIRLDGAVEGISIIGYPEYDTLPNVTLEAWVKPEIISTYADPIAKGSNYTLRVEANSDGDYRVKMLVYHSDYHSIGNSDRVSTLDDWHHTVAVYDIDAGVASIYVDGQFWASEAISGEVKDENALYLGKRFVGLMDQVSIYNEALTLSEIQSRYALYSQ
ncbi:hypothetical protein HN954_02240 [bacterium]|nr:hypothetical protein [bacterium]MBT6831588.1 hypothetical protein [bacterium]MBT6996227.1 hypothetical protein [bacterium]MBT7772474.1 hypothetical protein [bacterium]